MDLSNFFLFQQMKLEKKKSSSMDKILNKHRDAQTKAQEMRRGMSESVSSQPSRKFRTLRKYITNSLSGCFRCHSFQSLILPFNQVEQKLGDLQSNGARLNRGGKIWKQILIFARYKGVGKYVRSRMHRWSEVYNTQLLLQTHILYS